MTDDDGDPWRHRREALNTAYGYFLDQAERSSLGLMACLHTNGSDVRRTATAVRHAREAAHWGRLALAIKSMLVVLLVVGLAGGVEAQEDLWTPSIEQAGAVVMAEAVSAQSVSLWPLSAVLRGAQNACRSRIRHQAAAGSWTMPRQWEIQRTWLNSARAAVRSPAKPNGV